jgi:hypothetical protein
LAIVNLTGAVEFWCGMLAALQDQTVEAVGMDQTTLADFGSGQLAGADEGVNPGFAERRNAAGRGDIIRHGSGIFRGVHGIPLSK